MATSPLTVPPTRTLIGRALALRCPWCGSGGIVCKWFGLADRCPRCELRTERIAGHWIGAVGINVIVSFTALFAVLLGGTLASLPDGPGPPVALGAAAVAIGLPLLLVPWSRTLWLAIDLRMRPPRDHRELTGAERRTDH